MVSHYFTLSALAQELQPSIAGAKITDLFTQQKNEMIIRLEREGTESALAISVDPELNYIYLRDSFARAKKNSADVFPRLAGAMMESISIVPHDRVMVITTDAHCSLHLRLYNTVRSNIFLLDGGGTVAERFKQGEEHAGEFRAASREDSGIVPESAELFIGRFRSNSMGTLYAGVKKILPIFGSTYTREALHRAGIADENIAAVAITDDILLRIFTAARAIEEERKKPRPIIYYRADVPAVFSIVRLEHLSGAKQETFDSINRGVRTCVFQLFRTRRIDSEKEHLLERLKRIAAASRRSLEAAGQQLADAERSAEFEKAGTLLMGNLDLVAKGMKEAIVPDILNGGPEVRIVLDPKFSPVKNAERYFAKAKKAKLARKELDERRTELTQRDALLSKMLLHLDQSRSADEVREFRSSYAKELADMRIGGGAKDEEQFPFRRFTVAGGFEVWVGKNSANNDLLTMKYAKPNDLWFHARGSSGSHTVLKVPDPARPPSREAIHAAAGIAAYYSKMRNASSVPVAYCERKYVRKTKGLAEGAVYLDREKVILAPPKLPV